MIIVTIEMHSARDGKRSILGRAVLSNDGTGTVSRGNYEGVFWRKLRKPWRTGKHQGFARKRDNVWHLLHALLSDALEKKP